MHVMQSRGTQVTSMQVLTFQLWHLAGACFVAVISFFILSSPQSAIFVAYVLSKHRLAYIACASAGLQWWPVRHVRLTAHTSALFVCVLSVCLSVCLRLSFVLSVFITRLRGGGGLSLRARILGVCSTIHSPPALFFF